MMHFNLFHLARQLLAAPLLLRQDAAQDLLQALLPDQAQGSTSLLAPPDDEPERGYDVQHGIAIVPVQGMLVPETSWITDWLGWTGYDMIRASVAQAVADPDVLAIALHIDSPGGTVSGCFDTADLIHALRGAKPIWAVLDDGAYSAAYMIASAADRIVAPRAGGAGSIGVISVFADISRMLDENGITINVIHYGDAKADGAPFVAMPADARKRIQADINTLGEMFVATVAANRVLAPQAIRDTQAQCYLAKDAQALGLIDAVATPDEALTALLASLT